MSRRHRSHRKKKTWNRDIPDAVLLCHSTANALKRAESLCPNVETLNKYVMGVPEAQAIIHSYRLLAPVIEVRS